MKNLIFSLCLVFLLGTLCGVSYGKTDETKKTELVKYDAAHIDYAIAAPAVVHSTPFVIGIMKYKEAESAKLSIITKLFYQILKPDKNSRHSNYMQVNRYWKTNKNKNLKLCSGYHSYRVINKLC
jgi:hypothetical protein